VIQLSSGSWFADYEAGWRFKPFVTGASGDGCRILGRGSCHADRALMLEVPDRAYAPRSSRIYKLGRNETRHQEADALTRCRSRRSHRSMWFGLGDMAKIVFISAIR
jgi:hypothetical protein